MKIALIICSILLFFNTVFGQTKIEYSKDVYCKYNDDDEHECKETQAFSGNHFVIHSDKIVYVYGKSQVHWTYYIVEVLNQTEKHTVYLVTDYNTKLNIIYDKVKKLIIFDYGGDETQVHHLK